MKRSISYLFVLLAFSAALARAQSDNLTELQSGWRMISAGKVSADATAISQDSFDASRWYVVQKMPATVLQILEENGIYKDLYFGTNLATAVPPDLWKQDWWYRTTFTAPAGREVYSLIFKGVNYRADIWLNGHQVANHSQVVGMYNSFEFDVSKYIHSGKTNALAVKVIPERRLQDVNGVELADSWLDWINWKYIGYHDPEKHLDISFVPDRNAGVWKRVYLSSTGRVAVRNAYVSTGLPLPATSPATLTVYCDLKNGSSEAVSGVLTGEISRPGKPTIRFERNLTVSASETKEVALTPAESPQLSMENPDLWWPYQWGNPNLYQLKLDFKIADQLSDSETIHFGIRKITQLRDADNRFPNIGTGGNFYLQVNGKDFLVRGAVYTPDLLFRNDSNHDRAIMSYVKDLGLNLLRWELKIADEDMIDLADQQGVPVMLGWMCCAQWEKWDQWDDEDHRVASESLRARIRELRSHPSVFIWANGSDGLPPDPVLGDYHRILNQLHWQDAVVDTVSHVNRSWSGIHMAGPYAWRPPYYWFSDQFGPARGSSAEEGDNETIPPLDSIKKFIPTDKLWPINETWYVHAGANDGNNTLENIKKAVDMRYGPSSSTAEFSRKAQLAHYEDVRAQFENYGAGPWSNHKMMVYWMLNNHWPSFFGHLFDYYLRQGGGYFGAKKALRPVNVIYDYYATGDRSTAKIYLVNQTLEARNHLQVSVKFYDLNGTEKYGKQATDVNLGANTSTPVMSIGRVAGLTSTFFVRCELRDVANVLLADNVYWQSTTDDDLGGPKNDQQFAVSQTRWADFTALNSMPPADVGLSGAIANLGDAVTATMTITNNSDHIAFFMRAEVTKGNDGEEVLPITYEDNYITLFPHESRTTQATFNAAELSGQAPGLRLEGYNVARKVVLPTALASQRARRGRHPFPRTSPSVP
jgi:exo-1,4-beta-D-glucosaminidase